jgi:DNA polymerase I-like protein with 3'-5' exonuclease and polymerase domains
MSKAPACIVVDFETFGIEPRPRYPPKPVSLALKWPDQSEYKLMAWGHGDGSKAAGNNCTEKEARGELKKAYDSKYPLLLQNAVFDLDVAETAWELPFPHWEKIHELMYLTFLNDPHAESLGLKQTAERLLGIPPEEQDKMYEWIVANVPEAKRKPSTAGAYICRCPYQLVKPYHKGDLTRTLKLFNKLWPLVVDAGMLKAYQRELKLMPILLRNAQVGMRLDMDGLERDLPAMKSGVAKADIWLRKQLGIENIDSDRQLGEALYNKGIVTDFKRTAKGQLSVSKKSLTLNKFSDKRVFQALQYRSQMSTCINMFAEPWLELATQGKGVIFPNWSQVRVPKGGNDTSGARSGRIICSKPNWLNVPKSWKKSISAGYVHPAWLKVSPLPLIRSYCLPDVGEEWGKRDFAGQELRLFAHYEEGEVMRGYLADAAFDIHEDVRAEAERQLIAAGLRDGFDRDTAKGCVFGRLYGQGVTGLMSLLQLDEEEKPVAQIIQRAINTALPSIKALDDQLKALAKDGQPIMTFGGRLYYCEEPKYIEKFGRNVSFEYKLLNYLMQGSGADVTKETIIRFDSHPKRKGRFLNTVYDEVSFSTQKSAMKNDQKVLRECMLSMETDVPMLSDGEAGLNWGALQKWKD